VLKLWRQIGRDTRWVMTSYLLWGVGEGLWLYIQPLYVRSLGATSAETGFAMGMWGLARLLFILPVGVVSDRASARRIMLPGWYAGALGVLTLALAPGWRWAAFGFLLYGLSSVAIPVTNLYLAQAAQHDPTRAPDLPIQASFALLWTAYSAGLVVTPAIGGWIGDEFGLRSVFLISAAWFALSTWSIHQIRPYPAPERPAHGHDYRGMLRRGPVVLALGVLTFGFLAVLTGQPLASQYLEEVRGFSRSAIGVLGSISALGTSVFSLTLGRLSSWRGFFASLLLVMASFALMLWSGAGPVVAVAYFLLGAYYTTRPLAVAAISERVAEHQRGMAYALVDTLAGLATLAGTNLAGLLYSRDAGGPFWAGIVGAIAVMLIGGLLLRVEANGRRLVAQTRTGMD
jgi:predicted MFS family arabinose efflux permease